MHFPQSHNSPGRLYLFGVTTPRPARPQRATGPPVVLELRATPGQSFPASSSPANWWRPLLSSLCKRGKGSRGGDGIGTQAHPAPAVEALQARPQGLSPSLRAAAAPRSQAPGPAGGSWWALMHHDGSGPAAAAPERGFGERPSPARRREPSREAGKPGPESPPRALRAWTREGSAAGRTAPSRGRSGQRSGGRGLPPAPGQRVIGDARVMPG